MQGAYEDRTGWARPHPTHSMRGLSPWVLQGLLTGEPLLWVLLHQMPDEIFG